MIYTCGRFKHVVQPCELGTDALCQRKQTWQIQYISHDAEHTCIKKG
jgi:hypothetical protein